MENQMPIIVKADNLTKIYHRGSEEIRAVDGISLEIRQGEFVSFIGPSGSGKTTLINLIGCLDNPTSGNLQVNNVNIIKDGTNISENELTKIRRENYGYIFQKFYLIPTLTVSENILLPYAFYKKPGLENSMMALVTELGIEKRLKHLPGQLSGGEMQRVAIARALINKPNILLADEPTGNLDTRRSTEIGEILAELNHKQGITIILVTHNPALALIAARTVELQDGKIYTGPDSCNPKEGCA
jgi:putative ABC transport system ATP-binding protein